jgi:ABC-type transporter Mla subunit MlaD
MIERSSQFKIGLFVLAAVGIVLAGLLAFGLRRRFERKLQFETYVAGSVDGLSNGSIVKLKGVNVGRVSNISFSWFEYPGGKPECVVVHFEVRESAGPSRPSTRALDEAVRRGLRAIIATEGLTGPTFLALEEIDPARNPPLEYTWKPRSYVIPSAESPFSHIVRSVEATLSNLQKVDLERLNARLDHVLASADGTIQGLGQIDAKRLSDRLDSAAVELRALAKDARGTLRGMQLEAVGQDSRRLLLGLQDSNARLQQLIDRLSSIDVRELNETLAGARQAARHLNDTIEQLNRNPSGFLFGEPPPHVKGVGEGKE